MHDPNRHPGDRRRSRARSDKLRLSETTVKELRETVRRFAANQLGLCPESLFVDTHIDSITVTMRGFLAEAERNGAKERRIAELITRNHCEAYRVVRSMLELEIAGIIGREVESSSFFLDPRSNNATIILCLGKRTEQSA